MADLIRDSVNNTLKTALSPKTVSNPKTASSPKTVSGPKTVSKASEENSNPIAQKFIARIMVRNRLFLITVVVPTLISVIYFGLIASDVFISESRFVVYNLEKPTTSSSPLGALMKGAGLSRATDESYSIQDFILSRDALKILEEKLSLGKTFSSSQVDIFSRFAGLDWDNSFEALYRYYNKKIVETAIDSLTSISVLSVHAFSAEDAFNINQQLLEMSEGLVNQLNERSQQDMIRFTANEVASAEKKNREAALALSSYRNQKNVIDPEQQSGIQLQQISNLQAALVTAEEQLAQLQTFNSKNPQIPSLQLKVQNLRKEIDTATNRVAGGDRSLAKKAEEYQRLVLDRDFAAKQLDSVLASLEQARSEAQRKQLYLKRIIQPNKPDIAIEPRRIRNVIATFVIGLFAWGILALLLAGVREHRD
jgi:capsular polysaccharide transport system permease protein